MDNIKKINKNNLTQEDIYKTPFLFFQDHKKNYRKYAEDALKGMHGQDTLSIIFFSPENIELIQKNLIRSIYNHSNGAYLISNQSEQDLIVAMRAIFLQNAIHSETITIKEQIKQLNDIVVNKLTPNILNNVKAQMGYLQLINNPLSPIDRPTNTSSAGNRTLPSVTNTFSNVY
jgi:hypothetical protein